MSDKPKVVLLSGGLKESSKTNIALRVVADALEEAGVETRFVSVGEYPLPMLDPTAEPPATVEWIRQWVAEADGVVVGSPEYHAAPSGALKNMIDYLSYEEVAHKPVGLVAACGGVKGGVNTLNFLRIVFRALHAPVLVEQAIVTASDFDGDTLTDPDATARLRRLAEAMVRELRRG